MFALSPLELSSMLEYKYQSYNWMTMHGQPTKHVLTEMTENKCHAFQKNSANKWFCPTTLWSVKIAILINGDIYKVISF